MSRSSRQPAGLRNALPLWLGLACAIGVASPVAASVECDRECLEGVADNYLRALEVRSPRLMSLSPDLRFTENGIALYPLEGLWATADGPATYRIIVADPLMQQVGILAVIPENGTPVMIGTRLKVENGLVTEIEQIVGRRRFEEAIAALPPEPRAAFKTVIEQSRRSSREELVRIADTYFEAVENEDSTLSPFSDECDRMENGVQMAGPPGGGIGHRGSQLTGVVMSCADQMDSGALAALASVQPRRLWAVDEERGLVMGYFAFNIPGTVTDITLKDGTKLPRQPQNEEPFTVPVVEIFRVEGGKLKEIEAVLAARSPAGWPSGWKEGATFSDTTVTSALGEGR